MAREKHRRFTQNVGPDEEKVFQALRQAGFKVDRQTPVDRYNLDLTVGDVAVEVHRHPHGPHLDRNGLHQRVDYLTDRGWRVLYAWCPRGLNRVDLEQVVTLLKQLRFTPPTPGKYMVLRCYGEHSPTRGGDAYKGAYVVSTRSGCNPGGSDRRVRRDT
jgi:very-short-patch-repair endonuclease